MNFVFPIEVRAPGGWKGYLQRYYARKTARMIADRPARTYQFGGSVTVDLKLVESYTMLEKPTEK